MRKYLASCLVIACLYGEAQNVGIGTITPAARLHVTDSAVLFSAAGSIPITKGNPPASGGGRRMMWYPDKAAFRSGYVENFNWDKDSIGNYSFAVGRNTKAKGESSMAIGVGASALNLNTVAIGADAVAIGIQSFAFGAFSVSRGDFSTAIGYEATSSGDLSVAIGRTVTARARNSVAVGQYNDSIAGSSQTLTVATDPVFIIGNGAGNNSRSNAMTVLKNGKIGIGTTNPSIGLVEVSSTGLAPQLLLFQAAGNDYSRLSFRNANSNGLNRYWDVAGYTDPGVAANDRLNFWNNTVGNVLSLAGNGNATLMGTLTQNSDMRLKKNIHPLQNTLPLISRLQGYSYNWLDMNADPSEQLGFLAQDVQKVYPQLVREDEKGTLSINYIGVVPVLLEAIKEQQQQIEELRKLVEKLAKQ
jgi:hypothetical protein